MRAAPTWGLPAIALMAAATLRCTYAPDPASGTLKCSASTMECPEGYACDGTYCNKMGEADGGRAGQTGAAGAAGAGGATGTGGASGAGGSDTGAARFVGHWVYDAGSTETVSCTDGSNKDNALAGDYVDVALIAGGVSADYFCAWNLTVGPGGMATVLQQGQSCSRNMTDATTGVTKFTWHGTTFTMKTTDGKTATIASTITVDYVDDASKTGCSPTTTPCAGTCTIKIDATLTKS
jgi:hypothetical protein